MRILHIHNEIDCKGGAEVYLSDLQELLPAYNYSSEWLGIQKLSTSWQWAFHGEAWKTGKKEQLKAFLKLYLGERRVDLICVHNLFETDITDFCLEMLPVVKFSHSPVLVCPGRDKYWRFSDRPCTVPYGLHCFYHIYSEGCANRHPKRVIRSWNYVKEELDNARNRYAKVVVMSEYNFDRLRECRVPPDKILINPYFTRDTGQTVPVRFDKSGRLRLLFIGRIVEGKGVLQMIESVTPLLNDDPSVHLDIIGDGILMPEVRRRIEDGNLQQSISLHGWLDKPEIDFFLKNCYLVIFPSTYPESFGIVGIEAMMASKPVVAFDTGGVSTWLKDNINGFLVPRGDIDALSASVERLVRDEKLHQSMSHESRRLAVENFLPEKHMQKLIDLFDEIKNEAKLS